jgi:hypothetical protein
VVEFDVTESSYLFWVPPIDRERAMRITGARWDPHRECWVFPRTREVCNQLRAEFGKEARRRGSKPGIARTAVPREVEPKQPKKEQTRTAEQIELEHLRQELQRQAQELDQLKQAEVDARTTLDKQSALLESLRAENAELRRAAEPGEAFNRQIKGIALQATGNSKLFATVLSKLEVTEFLPLRIKDEVEGALSRYLGRPVGTEELTELIRLAKSKDTLGLDLHFLGKRSHEGGLTDGG